MTFLKFLQDEGLPTSLYYNADDYDKKGVEDIQINSNYYVLRDKNSTILQVLIPISEELQIHIYKSNGQYFLEDIPIEYQEKKMNFVTRITSSSVYNDIKNITNSGYVASFFVKTLRNRVNFRHDIHKNSIVAMIYKRKFRLGYPFGGIEFNIALLQTGKTKKYVIRFDNHNYNKYGETIKHNKLIRPLKKGSYWISSRFTKRRWHPILKKYRAHLGVDYASKLGVPIHATADGIVVFAGWSRGYGKTIKIKHRGGYLSLYAHMHKFAKHIKAGRRVKQGEVIGQVGSTGISTGPHVHFGLYKDGIAINPENFVSIKIKSRIAKDKKQEFKEYRDGLIEQLNILVTDFKSGRYITQPYSYDKLVCETTISNIQDEREQVEEPQEFIKDEEINDEVDKYIKEHELHLYIPPDYNELELSEDYLEY